MKPYITLEPHYKPTKRRCSIIGIELTQLTEELGFIPLNDDKIKRNSKAAWFDYVSHAEVRMTAVAYSEGTDWHQDGDTSPGARMDHALITWANTHPTQFTFRGISQEDGSKFIWQPEPYELIIARNLAVLHRRPPNTPSKRFMFRQRVCLQ